MTDDNTNPPTDDRPDEPLTWSTDTHGRGREADRRSRDPPPPPRYSNRSARRSMT